MREGKILNPEKLFFDEKGSADVQLDCKGSIIAPGFIDVQINGKAKPRRAPGARRGPGWSAPALQTQPYVRCPRHSVFLQGTSCWRELADTGLMIKNSFARGCCCCITDPLWIRVFSARLSSLSSGVPVLVVCLPYTAKDAWRMEQDFPRDQSVPAVALSWGLRALFSARTCQKLDPLFNGKYSDFSPHQNKKLVLLATRCDSVGKSTPVGWRWLDLC